MPSGHQVSNSEAMFLSFIISYFEGLPFQNFSHVKSRSEPDVNKRPTTPWAVLPPVAFATDAAGSDGHDAGNAGSRHARKC